MEQQVKNSWLIEKIEGFIKKYYLNQIIKGALIIVGAILIYIFIIVLGEYLFYFKPIVKKSLLLLLITVSILAAAIYIFKPLLQFSKLTKRLSYQDAAQIIGRHFPEIQDKLVNILQLSQNNVSQASQELVIASINQKSKLFQHISFSTAIPLKKNFKWSGLIIIPLVIAGLVYFINPKIITDSSRRLILVDQEFQKPAPFDIYLLNDNLEVLHFQDYKIQIEIKGKSIPQEAYVLLGNEKMLMNSTGQNQFEFILKKLEKDTDFRIEAAGYQSQLYTIKIVKKPVISTTLLTITYPAYLKKESETMYGFSDLLLPEGTTVNFKIVTQFSDNNVLKINDEPQYMNDKNELSFQFKNASFYQYFYENHQSKIIDSTSRFSISVVKDAFPQLSIQEIKDSINKEQILLMGTVSDDYGITKIQYAYKVLDAQGKVVKQGHKPIELSSNNNIPISHYEDLKLYNIEPGQKVEYFIEAWDNDGVNGAKYSRSATFIYQSISVEKMNEELQQQNEEMSKSIAEGKDKLNELNKQLEKLKENSTQNQELNAWEKKQNLELLEEQQKFIEQKLEEVQKRLDNQKDIQEKKDYNDAIKDKQEQIEKQLDQLKNKELSDQMKKLQELLNKQNPQMKMSDIEQMQMQNKLFDMSLERLEKMIKDLETQMKMEDLAEELNKLIEQQKDLNQKTQNNESTQSLAEQQKNIEKALDKLMKEDFQSLKEMAEDKDLSNEESLGKDAQEEMNQSIDNLKKNNKSQSQKNQSKAQEKMEQLSDKLSQMAGGMDMEKLEEDIKSVRQLLTNLLRLSFDQENLISQIGEVKQSQTVFKDYIKKQNQLISNSVVIRDSLFALSKRIDKLGPMINKETLELEKRLKDAVAQLESQNHHYASVSQQYAMTSANNLALILNELLNNLLQDMAMMMGQNGDDGQSQPGQGMPGGKKGNKPGDSPGDMMKDIITGQQKIGKGLRELQSQGQNGSQGQSPSNSSGSSGQNGGSNGQNGNQEMNSEQVSEQLSILAYEQSMLRQQLQQLNSKLNSEGIKGNAELIKELQRNMDQIETALINRKIDQNLLRQQENILTRLLQAEDAIRQQEQDNKREGKTGQNLPRPVPAQLQKYIDQQNKLKEYYKTTPPELKPFYKKLSEEYLKTTN